MDRSCGGSEYRHACSRGNDTGIDTLSFHALIFNVQVDCFSLIGENNTKTEGTLRVRFDQACACSPCILVLRNIEALIQSTQPLDVGKGV